MQKMNDNLSVLENGYGISLTPLMLFAMEVYKDDPCTQFKIRSKKSYNSEVKLEMKMQKAIAVIQFKLEGQLIGEHPEYGMNDRRLLHRIDFENGTVNISGRNYELTDASFPTINPDNPYELTDDEKYVVKKLKSEFIGCSKLKSHIRLLLRKGSLYIIR